MKKAELNKLRDAVRETVQELYAHKRGTTRWLVETVTERYPDLVKQSADMLMSEQIAKIARVLMKSEAASAKSAQMELPMEIAHLKLPAAISIPPSFDDGENDVLWTPLPEATFEELEGHIRLLESSVSADTRRLRKLRTLHRFISQAVPDERMEATIGEILAEIRRREKGAA